MCVLSNFLGFERNSLTCAQPTSKVRHFRTKECLIALTGANRLFTGARRCQTMRVRPTRQEISGHNNTDPTLPFSITVWINRPVSTCQRRTKRHTHGLGCVRSLWGTPHSFHSISTSLTATLACSLSITRIHIRLVRARALCSVKRSQRAKSLHLCLTFSPVNLYHRRGRLSPLRNRTHQ